MSTAWKTELVIGVGAMLQFGIVGSGLLGTRPQAEVSSVLEVTFNALTTERVLPLGQNDRADDLMAGNLRSQKRSPVRELRVREFHELVARSQPCPFILHDDPAYWPDGPAPFPGGALTVRRSSLTVLWNSSVLVKFEKSRLGWTLVCSPSTGPPFRITDAQIVKERSKPEEIVLHRPLEVFRLLA